MTENNSRKMDVFNSIYAKHYDTVFMYILVSLNNDRDLAGDCMQDVLTLVLQKLDTVINHPNPGGFFIVTAKNYINKYKASQRKSFSHTVPFDEALSGAAYQEDFDSFFEERVNIDRLKQEILRKLNSKELELYDMYYEKKISVGEVARNLQITEGNVKVRLFRLRSKVKKMVKDWWPL